MKAINDCNGSIDVVFFILALKLMTLLEEEEKFVGKRSEIDRVVIEF
jgi:hypothetical protein